MSSFDETQHPRNHPTGKSRFSEKQFSAPEIVLERDIRSAEFAVAALERATRRAVDPDGQDDAGRPRYILHYNGPAAPSLRITFDDGNLVRVEEEVYGHPGNFFDSSFHSAFHSPLLHTLQEHIDMARLQELGVIDAGGNSDNDGGSYGMRSLGTRAGDVSRDATDIAKRIRQDIKKAVAGGVFPDLTYRVHTSKFAGGQAIDIDVFGETDERLEVPDLTTDWNKPSPYATRLSHLLNEVGNQYNDTENNAMVDYYRTRFYLVVQLKDEREQQWDAEMRREKRAPRT